MASPGAAAATKASSGKKKGTTLHLTSFLKPEVTSWADDDPENDAVPPPLPTAPGLSSQSSYGSHSYGHQAPAADLPSDPPFKAYVANLAHNVTAADIGEFFHASYEVLDVHILKHQDTLKVKGAFVEFATQDDLKGGLTMGGQMLNGRPLRVDVASSQGRRGNDSRRNDDRGRYDDSRRGGYEERGGYHDRGGFQDRGSGYGDRRDQRGYQDMQDYAPRGGYGNRGGFQDRRGPEMGMPDRRHTDSGFSEEDATERWGHRNMPSLPHTPQGGPQGIMAAPSSPRPMTERKKLVLAPRSSKPVEEDTDSAAAAPAPAEGEAAEKPKKSNPFGAAKPVNAEARLKELEEKIAKEKAEAAAALREAEQKAKEAEQKAREQSEEAAARAPESLLQRSSDGSSPHEDSRPTGSGRFQGPPPGTTRNSGAPPSGPGRGQGRGANIDAANGRLSVPPGMDTTREEHGGRGGRGRRGRGREGGRGRGDYGGGRGPYPGGRGDYGPGGRGRGNAQYGEPQQPQGPTSILSHRESSADSSGFQEAAPAKSKGRFRGWESHTSATAPRIADHSAQGSDGQGIEREAAPAKAFNKFEMLNLEE